MRADEILSLLLATREFEGLPDEAVGRLAAAARVDVHEMRTLLLPRDMPAEKLWLVLEGAILVSLHSPSGGEARLPPLGPGVWVNWLGCLGDDVASFDYWSGRRTRLLTFPRGLLRDIAEEHPQLYKAVLRPVTQRFHLAINWMLSASVDPPDRRLAYLLVLQCDPASRDPADLYLGQDDLAAMGFGTRQRVARLLQGLEARGLIKCGRGCIRVVSPFHLAAFTRASSAPPTVLNALR